MNRQKQNLERDGYCVLEQVFTRGDLEAMREQLVRIVDGSVQIGGRRFQPESADDDYVPVPMTGLDTTWRGPDIPYRKISAMEYDPVFLAAMQSQRIKEFLTSVLGPDVSIMRATLFTKTPDIGAPLPWHQDVSLDWPVSRQPQLVLWYSVDPVGSDSGALEVVTASHKFGVIGRGHLLPKDLEFKYAAPDRVTKLLPEEGDVVVFDAALLHRSGVNRTMVPRRAMNVVLISGTVTHTTRGFTFPVLIGENAMMPDVVRTLSRADAH